MPNEASIQWEITPENSGLTITRFINEESGSYAGIEISGIPKEQGEINIYLYGGSVAPYVCIFDKTFILKVNAL